MVTCGKQHFVKCLAGTSGCFSCGEDDHKVRYGPAIEARGRHAKKLSPNVWDGRGLKRNHFYAL